jgi:hypothetical protein
MDESSTTSVRLHFDFKPYRDMINKDLLRRGNEHSLFLNQKFPAITGPSYWFGKLVVKEKEEQDLIGMDEDKVSNTFKNETNVNEDSSERRKRYIKQTAIFRLEGLLPLKSRSRSIIQQARPIFRVIKTPRSRSLQGPSSYANGTSNAGSKFDYPVPSSSNRKETNNTLHLRVSPLLAELVAKIRKRQR